MPVITDFAMPDPTKARYSSLANVRTRTDRPIRVGILGCSDIARRKFIPALLLSRKATLAVIASRDKASALSLVPEANCPGMDYQQLITSSDVDLVYISLPNHLHEKWVIRALEQGKHVICEKPLGLSLPSVNRMLETAERHGRFLFENLMYLQHPQHQAVKSLITAGRIGKLLSMHTEFTFPGPIAGDFRLNPTMGGGAFHDLNRYPLSAALFFLKGKKHSFVRGNNDIRDKLNLSLQATSVTDEAEAFSFTIAFGQTYRSFYEIIGECGSIGIERAYTTPADRENTVTVMIDSRNESFSVPPCDHFLSTIEHVSSLILRGTWSAEHERARELAELANMFHDNCIKKGQQT